MDGGCSLPLPDAYLDFLKENGIDPSIYVLCDSTPRYISTDFDPRPPKATIRSTNSFADWLGGAVLDLIKPGSEDQVQEIEDEIKCKLEKVVWLPGFFSIPPSIQISSLKAYQGGKIYGMDAASGAAVWALNVSPGDHVLDLCAAPGAKLCMLLDLLGRSGSVTGVDVARHRLAACRTMLQKYALGDHCRLFVADGTTFSLLPLGTQWDTESCAPETEEKMNAFKEWTPRRPWKERKRASKARNNNASELVPGAQEPDMIFYGRCSGVVGLTKNGVLKISSDNEALHFGYDKVLVDAECTHDGSIRHIQKFEYWGWKTLQRRVLDAQRTDTLTHLQLQLLINGFRLLKAGGSLVYSTCSLTTAQNEDVVEKFLSQNAFAELQEIDAAKNWPCRSGRIPKTLRFDPSTSQTSGLFVAKFTKTVS